MKKKAVNFFWFRRDLRLDDNAGLYHALKAGLPVVPVFIFDKNILDKLEFDDDARVDFIHEKVSELKDKLKKKSSDLIVEYGDPVKIWPKLKKKFQFEYVYTNHDYEPYAKFRDEKIAKLKTYKDQVIFEKDEVLKDDGDPYTIFTPYSKKWRAKLKDFYLKPYPTKKYFKNFYKDLEGGKMPSLKSMGFKESSIKIPSKKIDLDVMKTYNKTRDIPSLKDGTSRLGIHLRFGTISIRELASLALVHNDTYLNELIWRDFYQQILWHFPKVYKDSFKSKYDKIKWRNNKKEFKAWCEGKTGFPIVDAGMRQLNETGYMHNRVRMITASFLTKDLLVDWRWGERYFAQRLLDYELASNNGGWQWAAGTGCDAAPYFRIFNPDSQQKKFDPDFKYIKKWVPEFDSDNYPQPIVDHKEARKRALEVYKSALK